MQYRSLGKTGLKISEIGFGAWGIGGSMWLGGNDAESLRALHAAADLGVNFVDTALAYGDGHSETLVGKFVRERKERIIIATKIPPKNGIWPARAGSLLKDVFPYEYIIRCAERSLRHLGVDIIDLEQFHVWLDDWAGAEEWKRAIEDLKKAGKIRHAGISINDHQPSNGILTGATGLIDSYQVIYNIFDQSPEDELLPAVEKNGIGIIARVPFDEGALTGSIGPDSTFPPGDWRHKYFKGERKAEVAKRVNALRPLLGKEASTLPELALKFCLHHPAVSTVIPGMRTVKNVQMNCAASDGKRLSEGMVRELGKHRWEKNFY